MMSSVEELERDVILLRSALRRLNSTVNGFWGHRGYHQEVRIILAQDWAKEVLEKTEHYTSNSKLNGGTDDSEHIIMAEAYGTGFETAIAALKQGKKVAREGWNGKGMFVYLNKGSHDFAPVENEPEGKLLNIEGVSVNHFESGDVGTGTRLPNINMRSAHGNTVTGWLASQTDMLAEDWCILD